MPDFTDYPDLASRDLAGSVISANDELFAPRQNLIMPSRPPTPSRSSATPARSTTAGRPGGDASRASTGRSSGSACPASSTASSWTPRSSRATTRRTSRSRRPRSRATRKPTCWNGAVDHRWCAKSRLPGRHRELLRGRQSEALDPRPAEHLPRRRGGPLPGARRGGRRSALPDHHRRPAGPGERRPAAQHLRRLLLHAGEPDPGQPGPDHGRGLGERPPPWTGQRLGDLQAGRPGRADHDRGRHVVLHRQRARRGPGQRGRRDGQRPRRRRQLVGRGAEDPGAGGHPAPLPGRGPTARPPTCGSTSIPTAA